MLTGIFMTSAAIGVVCASGFGMATALKWFHTYEPNMNKRTKAPKEEGRPHESRINNLERRIKSGGSL